MPSIDKLVLLFPGIREARKIQQAEGDVPGRYRCPRSIFRCCADGLRRRKRENRTRDSGESGYADTESDCCLNLSLVPVFPLHLSYSLSPLRVRFFVFVIRASVAAGVRHCRYSLHWSISLQATIAAKRTRSACS
jgi:hypothetical protein